MHPQILHLGRLVLPTFGVLAALGLMAALILSFRTATLVGLNPDRLWNAGLFSLIAAFILSRFLLVVSNLHTFLAHPLLLLAVPSLTPIGVLLTALATLLYLWLLQIPIAIFILLPLFIAYIGICIVGGLLLGIGAILIVFNLVLSFLSPASYVDPLDRILKVALTILGSILRWF